MPSLNFFLDVTSPDIPSTTAVCSGFLNLNSKREHCESCLPPVKILDQMVCQGGAWKRSQGVRRRDNPFAKQNQAKAHFASFPSPTDGFPLLLPGRQVQCCMGTRRTLACFSANVAPADSMLYRHTHMSGVSIPVQCLCVCTTFFRLNSTGWYIEG